MDEDVIGGRASLVADGERENFHRSARTLPAIRATPDTSPVVTISQVTASLHDFAVSLGLTSSRSSSTCLPCASAGQDISSGTGVSLYHANYKYASLHR
jgi:hypothetical protein